MSLFYCLHPHPPYGHPLPQAGEGKKNQTQLVGDQKAVLHRIYNLGNNRTESLMDFIHTLENIIGKKANIRFEPLQAGDVKATLADISETTRDFGFLPTTNIDVGLEHFVKWYREYYGV